MSFKSLLTVVRQADEDAHCLSAAAELAEAWEAHLADNITVNRANDFWNAFS